MAFWLPTSITKSLPITVRHMSRIHTIEKYLITDFTLCLKFWAYVLQTLWPRALVSFWLCSCGSFLPRSSRRNGRTSTTIRTILVSAPSTRVSSSIRGLASRIPRTSAAKSCAASTDVSFTTAAE